MELDDGLGEDEPVAGWISPDDRLWRHPSEVVGPRRRRDPRGWDVALLAGLIGSLLTAGLIFAGGGFNRNGPAPIRSVEVIAAPNGGLGTMTELASVEAVADRIRPAIVQVRVSDDAGRGSGSGVLFRDDGYILTNNHVIEGARSISVLLANGKQVAGRLVGGDRDTDIAVIHCEGISAAPAPLGTAANLRVGQPAIAIGEPLGLAGGPSVSVGVVSALGRQLLSRQGALLDMIQTDAPIAPGSSGGALLDASGAVIGITTAIAISDVGAEGLGFATPIDVAREVAEQLITTGKVVHVWLGIQGEDLDAARADAMDVDGGAVVKEVQPSSPAASAGLAAQDVITHVNDKPVRSMAALVVALRQYRPGESVKLSVHRGGRTRTLEASLAERPENLGR